MQCPQANDQPLGEGSGILRVSAFVVPARISVRRSESESSPPPQTCSYSHCRRSTWVYAIESRAWQGHLRVIQPALDNTANSLISHFGYLYVEQSELDVQYRCI
ncbi:hypothetical protein EIQ17_10725 [Xanthomonas campestris pv. campestris]